MPLSAFSPCEKAPICNDILGFYFERTKNVLYRCVPTAKAVVSLGANEKNISSFRSLGSTIAVSESESSLRFIASQSFGGENVQRFTASAFQGHTVNSFRPWSRKSTSSTRAPVGLVNGFLVVGPGTSAKDPHATYGRFLRDRALRRGGADRGNIFEPKF